MCCAAPCAGYSRQLRSIPASESESSAQFGLDPSQLAALAAKDADRALTLEPDQRSALICQGEARMLTEDYAGAQDAYLQVLALDAEDAEALVCSGPTGIRAEAD